MSTTQPAVAAPSNQRPWIFDLTAARAQHSGRNLRRLGAGRHGRDGLQLRHSHADRGLAHQQRTSGLAGHGRSADFSRRRLAGWIARRPLRPRTRPADHHPVVRALHLSERIHQLLLATADDARTARPGFRRGVGGRLGADGRSHPRAAPRQGRRHRARRMGGRMGRHGHLLYRALLRTACRNSVACHVLDRHSSGAAGLLHPAQRSRARSLQPDARTRSCTSGKAAISWKSSARRC